METLILSAKHRMWLQFPLCPFYEKKSAKEQYKKISAFRKKFFNRLYSFASYCSAGEKKDRKKTLEQIKRFLLAYFE